MTGEPALELQRIVKRFGSIPAIDGVDMRVEQGERRALLGTNGAGKTTVSYTHLTLPTNREV